MDTVTIKDTQVPALGFGTWMIQGQACIDSVEDALSLGYRHIDTAQIYENEAEVGKAIGRSNTSRQDIFLTTKLWRDNIPGDRVLKSLHKSLRQLETDYVDLLLIHWPMDDVPVEETLAPMIEAKEAGKVRHLGVSNYPPSWVKKATSVTDIACNQVEYHPFLGQDALLELAEAHGMMLTAYSPLARGRVLDDETLQEIAQNHGKSPAQVALRWLIDQPRVAAIPKAESPEHRRSNLEIFDFQLTDGERSAIDDLPKDQRVLDPDFAPTWER